MAKTIEVRVIVKVRDDGIEDPSKSFDETLTLEGFKQYVPGQRIQIGPSDTSVNPTETAPIMRLAFSHDYPFKARLKASETQYDNLRLFLAIGHDKDTALSTEDLLIDGNSSNVADLEVWTVEKP